MTVSRDHRRAAAIAASCFGLLLSACAASSAEPAPAPGSLCALSAAQECAPIGRTIDAAMARVQLETLRVAGRAPKSGYSREQFGERWSDDVSVPLGHNGCNTRDDILQRDLTGVSFVPKTRDCKVAAGDLADAYTGKNIHFVRGPSTSDDVQVDHVVALSDAWQKGAQQLPPERRRDLANDPLNLQATDGPTNQQKGDSDAATWLPPSKSYRCTYVSRQIQVKAAYQLWVTQAEKDAMARELETCQ